MKHLTKILVLIVLTLIVGISSKVYAGDSFTSLVLIYDTNGTFGTSATLNSFAQVSYYRTQTAETASEAIQIHDNVVDGVTGSMPAYSMMDIGSWWDNPDVDNLATEIMAAVEVRNGLNGWTGPSFVGADRSTTTINNGGLDFRRITLESIPTPLIQNKTETSITIGWTGLYDSNWGPNPGTINLHNTIKSYSVYRSVNGGSYQIHGSPYILVNQIQASPITYTDTDVVQGSTYKYKLTINWDWPGNTTTKKYLETTAEGPESAIMSLSPVLDHFEFSLTSPQSMDSPFTGTNQLVAMDVNGNTIPDYNTSGADVTIIENTSAGTVSGLGTSGNVVLASSFVGGIANLTGSMTYGGTYGIRQFKATAGTVNTLSNEVTIQQGGFAKLGINLSSSQKNATVFSIANVSAQDIYGNILTNFDSIGENIAISVGGAGSINVVSLTPSDFVSGVANLVSKNFTFTGLVGSHNFTFTSGTTGVTASKTSTITVGDVTSVKIVNGNGDTATEINTANVNVDSPLSLYVAGYDVSGNFVNNSINGNWTSTGFDASDSYAQVSSVGTSSISFAPRKTSSSGTISFDNGSGLTDTTGILTVVSGTAKTFTANAPTDVTAGTAFTLSSIIAYDKYENISTDYNGEKTITLSGASNGTESGTPTTTFTATFTNGVATTTSNIILVKVESVDLTLTQDVVTGTTNTINVGSATATHLHATAPTTATAGTAFNITDITAHDAYGNIATSYNSSQTISCTNLSSNLSPNGDVAVCNPTIIAFSSGISTNNLEVTLYKRETLSISLSDGSLSGSTGNIAVGAAVSGSIEYVSGNNQTAAVNTNLTNPLVVLVKDIYGNLKNDQAVNFVVTLGDGSVGTAAPVTDASGLAQTTWKVGTVTGTNNNTVEARLTGVTGSPIIFTASATPAVASNFEVTAPTLATAGTLFQVSLKALDSLGNIDTSYNGNKSLTYSGPGNGITIGTPTYSATANFVNGVAIIDVTLVKAETVSLNVSSGSISGTSNSIVVSAGSTSNFAVIAPNTVTVNVSFAITSIRTTDQFGNNTTDYSGTKNLIYSGPTSYYNSNNASYTTSVDFTNGLATTILATNLVKVEATTISVTDETISGTSNSVQVINPEDYYLEYVSGNNQTGTVGTQLALPLVIAVRDKNGLLAIGKTVTFTDVGTSISGSLVSGSDGLIQTNWTLGTNAGTQTVTFGMSGITSTVQFSATAGVGQASKLSFTTGSQSVRVNAASSVMTVCLQDQYGNTVLPLTSDLTINLSESSSTKLFATSIAGPWDKTSATIASGVSCSNFYYKNSATGSYSIQASADSYTSDTQSITVIANDLVSMEIIPATFSVSQSGTQQMVARVYNQNSQEESNVTIVWSMADETAGAITQSGLFYPTRTSLNTFTNAIKASVGSLMAFATVTVTNTTAVSTVTPTPTITPTPTTTTTTTTTTNTTNTNTYTTTTDSSTRNNIIIINNYYLGTEEAVSSDPITITRSDYPVILSPKQNSLISEDNVTVSGTASPNSSVVLTDSSGNILGTGSTDDRGNWAIILGSDKIADNQMQIIATIHGTSFISSPVLFSIKQEDVFGKIMEYINSLY